MPEQIPLDQDFSDDSPQPDPLADGASYVAGAGPPAAKEAGQFRARWWVVLGVAVLHGAIAIAAWRGYQDLESARSGKAELESILEDTEARIELLQREVESVARDPHVIERLAREQLGFVRDDEKVLVFPRFSSVLAKAPRLETDPAEPPQRP